MSEFEAVYAIWKREVVVFTRERERVLSSIVSPILWLVLFGTGLGASVEIQGYNYQQFIFPGIVAMATLFTAIFYGMYIIWDRKLDVLKAVLVAPVSRTGVFAGKMLGGITDAMFQASIILLIGVLMGINFSVASFALALLVLLAMTVSIVSIGLVLGSNLKTPEAFNLVMTFVLWPMFMLSGALFPISNLPDWLAVLTYANPLTYGVDALRGAILGIYRFPLTVDFAAIIAFSLVTIYFGIVSFGRMQQAK